MEHRFREFNTSGSSSCILQSFTSLGSLCNCIWIWAENLGSVILHCIFPALSCLGPTLGDAFEAGQKLETAILHCIFQCNLHHRTLQVDSVSRCKIDRPGNIAVKRNEQLQFCFCWEGSMTSHRTPPWSQIPANHNTKLLIFIPMSQLTEKTNTKR